MVDDACGPLATTRCAFMFTALDADPERLDQHEQNFVQQIREHGWFGTHVMPDDKGPGFSYTTGFWLKFSFPEMILFSMSKETTQDTFWHIYRELEAGRRLPVGEPTARYSRMRRPCFFRCRRSGINLISGGADGFMEAIISSVSNSSSRIEAESFRGRRGRQRIS
jgi:hypothetical protein